MEDLTNEEIQAMVGVEFIYIYDTRGEIPAVIAAFDPEVGLTCLATETEGSDGYDLSGRMDENGNICVMGYTATMLVDLKHELSRALRYIKHLGYYKASSRKGFGFAGECGSPSCSFS